MSSSLQALLDAGHFIDGNNGGYVLSKRGKKFAIQQSRSCSTPKRGWTDENLMAVLVLGVEGFNDRSKQ
jgi:hypothetical protein